MGMGRREIRFLEEEDLRALVGRFVEFVGEEVRKSVQVRARDGAEWRGGIGV